MTLLNTIIQQKILLTWSQFYQDENQTKLEDSKEVTAGSEMSRKALISIFTKSSSHCSQ